MNEKVERHLERKELEKRRRGVLRGTALIDISEAPEVGRLLEILSEALLAKVGEYPPAPDPERLGEPVGRAKLRAVGGELRHLVQFVDDVAAERDPSEGQALLSAADRKWAELQRRDILRMAVRFERRLGAAPEKAKNARGKRRRGTRK